MMSGISERFRDGDTAKRVVRRIRELAGDDPAVAGIFQLEVDVVVRKVLHQSFLSTVTQLVTAEPPTLKATPISAFFAFTPMASPMSCL